MKHEGEPNSAAAPEEILEAAAKVFLDKGFRNTSMEDIIRETTLSRGGFYYYYANTKEIIFTLFKKIRFQQLDEIFESWRAINSDDPMPYLVKLGDYLINRLFRKTEEHMITVMFLEEASYDRDYLDHFQRTVDQLIHEAYLFLKVRAPSLPEESVLKPHLHFLIELINGLGAMVRQLKAEASFKSHQQYLHALYCQVIKDMLDPENDTGTDEGPVNYGREPIGVDLPNVEE